MWNIILLMPYCRVALVNIQAVSLLLLTVNARSFAEVLLFNPEVTNDLTHVCIHVVEENIGDVPIGLIFMDHNVVIRQITS